MKKMGFGDVWTRWMEVCIFNDHMSILVNGRDFKVERGLRQGDLLSPFLFVIAAEGLSQLFCNAFVRGDFKGFNVWEGLSIDLVQFVDDTLILGKGCWKNLWCTKSILRGFELVSGLSVNYH